jgi:hypothetical protein
MFPGIQGGDLQDKFLLQLQVLQPLKRLLCWIQKEIVL